MKGLYFSQIRGMVGYSDRFEMEIPTNRHPVLVKIMSQCLKRNPKERPSFERIYTMLQEYKVKSGNQDKSKDALLG